MQQRPDKKTKENTKAIGDALIWHAIIALAKSSNRPVIFVTDDVKDDWWLRFEGKTIAPLPDLRAEMLSDAGQQFHMYQADQFLVHASELLKTKVEDQAVTEAADVRDQLSAGGVASLKSVFLSKLSTPHRYRFSKGTDIEDWKMHEEAGRLMVSDKGKHYHFIPMSKLEQQSLEDWQEWQDEVDRQQMDKWGIDLPKHTEWASSGTLLQSYGKRSGELFPAGYMSLDLTAEEIETLEKAKGEPVFLERFGGYFSMQH